MTWWVLDGSPRAGYCAARITPDGRKVRLERAYVSPEFRGRGIQRAMIRVRLAFGRSRGAEIGRTYTWIENIASQRALARAGFLPIECKPNPAGGAWLIYEKTL